MEVRPGRTGDLRAINDIYNHYVRTSAATFDLDEQTGADRRRWFDTFGDRYRLVVADEGGDVVGYASTTRLFERRAYETSAVASVYLRADRVGRGLGTALYGSLFETIVGEDLHRLYAGITLPNDPSVRLHERFGFREVAHFTEQGRKFGRYWDVAWFEKAL